MKRIAITTIACCIALSSMTADALPPRTGIDLPTVLALKDQARRVEFQVNYKRDYDELATVKTIVIDPGHGGENEGALGVAGILEKYLTLELAYSLREALQKKYPTLRVVMTRYWDAELSLTARSHIANLQEADLFISLHYNAATHKRAVGFETFFLESNWVTPGMKQKKGKPVAGTKLKTTGIEKPSKTIKAKDHTHVMTKILNDMKRQRRHKQSGLFAKSIQDALKSELLDSVNRGVKQANFTVLKGALMPAIVVEAGFLTHPDEGQACIEETHRQKVVNALMTGIENFDIARSAIAAN